MPKWRNQPEFTDEELVLLLDAFLNRGGLFGGTAKLAEYLNQQDFPASGRRGDDDFRTPDGVRRAASRFRAQAGQGGEHRPHYDPVWRRYAEDPSRLRREVRRIVAS